MLLLEKHVLVLFVVSQSPHIYTTTSYIHRIIIKFNYLITNCILICVFIKSDWILFGSNFLNPALLLSFGLLLLKLFLINSPTVMNFDPLVIAGTSLSFLNITFWLWPSNFFWSSILFNIDVFCSVIDSVIGLNNFWVFSLKPIFKTLSCSKFFLIFFQVFKKSSTILSLLFANIC